ncbi:sensor histidine kinase, partial [Amycolatopsis sp. H20-H5]|uniref:sensor histidine kinase n=1 Tax=Amycolatopsis sp. H20-H5 TaxID=3046309 RepID=UPI002DBF5791
MRWRPGLRESIALTVVLITVAATVAMALVAYQLQAGPVRERFAASALAGFQSDAQQANKHQAPMAGASKVERIADFMAGRSGLTWDVYDLRSDATNGQYFPAAGSGGFLPAALAEAVTSTRNPVVSPGGTADSPQLIVAGEVSPNLVLVEFYSLKKLDAELSTLRSGLTLIAIAVSLLAALAGVLAARRIQRRVGTAAKAARRFGEGALDIRLPVQGHDELADLAGSFNAMAEQLGESIEQLRVKDRQQRRFVADVAHDLRTPLASMIAATDSLHSPLVADRERSAELLGTQVRRLSTLVEDLLEMSRFDAGAADFRPETVDLEALVADAAALSAPDGDVAVRCAGDVTVLADPRRVHTIV